MPRCEDFVFAEEDQCKPNTEVDAVGDGTTLWVLAGVIEPKVIAVCVWGCFVLCSLSQLLIPQPGLALPVGLRLLMATV